MKQSGQLGNVGVAASDRCKTENAPFISSQRPETCRKSGGWRGASFRDGLRTGKAAGRSRTRWRPWSNATSRPPSGWYSSVARTKRQWCRWPLIGVLFFSLSAFGATSGLPKRVLILQSFVRDTPPFSQAAAFRTALAQELTHQLVWAAELHRRTCGFHHRSVAHSHRSDWDGSAWRRSAGRRRR